jgi:hypothetical protein
LSSFASNKEGLRHEGKTPCTDTYLIGNRNHKVRAVPTRFGLTEKRFGLFVPLVAPIQEGDEDDQRRRELRRMSSSLMS